MNNNDRRQGRWWTAAVPAMGLLILAGTAVGLRQPHHRVPKHYDVAIQGVAFVPATLEIEQGDTVVWTNQDIVPHTATSGRKGGWDTGPLAHGERGRYVADRKGEEPYACLLHPVMIGKLIVR